MNLVKPELRMLIDARLNSRRASFFFDELAAAKTHRVVEPVAPARDALGR